MTDVPVAKAPLQVQVDSNDPEIIYAAEQAVRRWNTLVGGIVVELVPRGTSGAVKIHTDPNYLHGEAEGFYNDANLNVGPVSYPASSFPGGYVVPRMAGYGGAPGEVTGNPKGLRDTVTMAHEIGHALGLLHPNPKSTFFHYIPQGSSNRVAAVGIMGNGFGDVNPTYPQAPSARATRQSGPSIGEIRFIRRIYNIHPSPGPAYGAPAAVQAPVQAAQQPKPKPSAPVAAYNPTHQQI